MGRFANVESATSKEDSNGDLRYYYRSDTQFNGVQELKFREEARKCHPDCVYEMNFTDYDRTGVISKAPWRTTDSSNQFLVNVQTYSTDIDTGNFALGIMPYVIALINMVLMVGSTPYWNPLQKYIGNWVSQKGGGF